MTKKQTYLTKLLSLHQSWIYVQMFPTRTKASDERRLKIGMEDLKHEYWMGAPLNHA
jgi:hypothetical protein